MGSSEIGPGFLIYGGDMPEHHKVNVVRIDEILPHPNADTLGIVYIGGYQVVVKKDNYKVGDLAIYVPPDTIVPEHHAFAFLWEGTEPTERRRRVTVRRFRKEWSEGLLMPMSDFANPVTFAEGDDVAELLGFKHYEEPEPVQNINRTKVQYQSPFRSPMAFWYWLLYKLGIKRDQLHGSNAKPPKSAPPVYDVENFKNYSHTFVEGEEVIVTEKIHGSNGRYMFDGKKIHVGSKNLWKSEKSTCIWRRALKELPWIEEWCRANADHTLYAEVTPTQKGYTYGRENVNAFVFDILKPNGEWMDKAQALTAVEPVPVLYAGPFNYDTIKALVEGPSMVPGAKNIREGIVITSAIERQVRGVGRAQLKLKSMAFLEKETK
jgi:hypothetical protein